MQEEVGVPFEWPGKGHFQPLGDADSSGMLLRHTSTQGQGHDDYSALNYEKCQHTSSQPIHQGCFRQGLMTQPVVAPYIEMLGGSQMLGDTLRAGFPEPVVQQKRILEVCPWLNPQGFNSPNYCAGQALLMPEVAVDAGNSSPVADTPSSVTSDTSSSSPSNPSAWPKKRKQSERKAEAAYRYRAQGANRTLKTYLDLHQIETGTAANNILALVEFCRKLCKENSEFRSKLGVL